MTISFQIFSQAELYELVNEANADPIVERVQGVYVKYSHLEGGNEFLDIFYGQGKLILVPAAFFSTTRSGLSLAR